MLERVLLAGLTDIADKGFGGHDFEGWTAARGAEFLRPDQASSRAARHPGLRRDDERWLRQPLPAELAQCRAPIGLEAGDVRTRRGAAEREPRPPVPARGVLDVHRHGAVDDVADAGRPKEVGEVAGPAAGADRPGRD